MGNTRGKKNYISCKIEGGTVKEQKVLIVDDEEDIRRIVMIYLESNGIKAVQASGGKEALALLKKEPIDLVICDVMMPDMDGITLCLKIREQRNVPVIMLSAKDQDMDKVMGLTAGADDYVAKPFNPVELLARVRAQLRRYHELNPANRMENELRYDNLTLLLDSHKLLKDGEEIRLTPTEFKIIKLLWTNQGMVFSTEHIFEKIWGEEEFEIDNTVMVHIKNLREKIEEDKRKPQFIRTVWGVGYKFGA